MKKTEEKEQSKFEMILEAIVLVILLPVIIVFKLLLVTLVFAFLASPFILIGYGLSKL